MITCFTIPESSVWLLTFSFLFLRCTKVYLFPELPTWNNCCLLMENVNGRTNIVLRFLTALPKSRVISLHCSEEAFNLWWQLGPRGRKHYLWLWRRNHCPNNVANS
jgi:hypothetical protein